MLIFGRKHTGERPFQCHCNRRFSRLDNLRQHAQTVHVNEEIPGDSLAATGTRFQRQIRTDRVRPPGRARAGTGGSHAGHSRGHSRNLSTSSIGSTASTFTAAQEAPKRRPPPLIMANESSRVRLNQDAMNSPPSTPPSQFQTYSGNSPGFSTPTSATFSTGLGSPGFGSSYASPASSRNPSFYGTRTPGRRLSVPSGTNPFQSPHGSAQPPPHLSPLASSAASFSNNGSVFASPTSSTFSFIRGDPAAAAEAEWRRRTWHPNTLTSLAPNYSRPATSSLSYSQTPDAPQPAFAPNATAAAGQAPRLPGIESFDQVQHRPSTPPRRRLSPMQIDQSQPTPQVPPPRAPGHVPFQRGHHRGHVSWDLGLHSNLTRLERARDVSQWSQQTIDEIQHSNSQPSQATQILHNPDGGSSGTSSSHPPAAFEISQAQPPTPRRNKRFGWYNGPMTPVANLASRTTPEDSSSSEGVPTPGTSVAEYQPAIVHSNGYVETQRPQLPTEGLSNVSLTTLSKYIKALKNDQNCTPQPAANSGYVLPTRPAPQAAYFIPRGPPANDMGRLEALVAVATSEEKAATAAR